MSKIVDCCLEPLKNSTTPFPYEGSSVKFHVNQGETVWLRGPSGAGKTLCTLQLLGLFDIPGVSNKSVWDSRINEKERSGMLLQQGVLVDDLSVYENIKLALMADNMPSEPRDIQRFMEMVSLKYPLDAKKMPEELSGGMLRRATLAQMMAQSKALVVLDEPFVGLDDETATSIARELVHLQKAQNTAFILISHQSKYAKLLNVSREIPIIPRAPAIHDCSHGQQNRVCRRKSMSLLVFIFKNLFFWLKVVLAGRNIRVDSLYINHGFFNDIYYWLDFR
eukprot:m.116189 g.116189  ORF g.116189 m.116189 type:complete len:279 (-) comp9302_c0_seq8:2547-3383(-)